jgi:hypothetical protein
VLVGRAAGAQGRAARRARGQECSRAGQAHGARLAAGQERRAAGAGAARGQARRCGEICADYSVI